MVDLKRLWSSLIAGLHAVFAFISFFAVRAPLQLGYVLIVMAILISIYGRRRRFYGAANLAADWNPSYGGVVGAKLEQFFFGLASFLAGFFGVMVLFQHYMPVLFQDIFEVVISATSDAPVASQ